MSFDAVTTPCAPRPTTRNPPNSPSPIEGPSPDEPCREHAEGHRRRIDRLHLLDDRRPRFSERGRCRLGSAQRFLETRNGGQLAFVGDGELTEIRDLLFAWQRQQLRSSVVELRDRLR